MNLIYSQTEKRKAYRKWYHANEPESVKVARREWKKTEKGRRCVKNTQLKKAYGITLVQYEEMLAKQDGRCAICHIASTEFKKGLHVDHNHKTGKIRGLLCTNCNTRLVAALEDPLLDKAMAYIQGWAA